MLEPELMDDPALPDADHEQALRALSRVHRLSGTGVRLRRVLDRVSASTTGPRPLRILDVACGGGDLCLDAARWADRRERRVEVTGFDLSGRALDWAAGRMRESRFAALRWQLGDATRDLPEGPFDLVASSLFLHHLEEDDATRVLREMRRRARLLLVEDLRRTRAGLMLAHLTLRVFSRSRVARVDGPLSVRAGWDETEIRRVATSAGLGPTSVRTGWPQRWILEESVGT